MIKEYLAYIKDNPKGYWFKRKFYGWGWTPVRWQGWLVVGLFLVIVIFATDFLMRERYVEYFVLMISAIVMLIVAGYLKGEKPRWQWGLQKRKDTEI